MTHPFTANLDGNGYKISNFRFAGGSSPNVGFFGALDGAEIRNLMLEPGKPVKGVRQVGILAGNAKNSKIFNCQVKGDVEGTGAVGGMIGHMEGSTVENGMAQVTVRTTGRAAERRRLRAESPGKRRMILVSLTARSAPGITVPRGFRERMRLSAELWGFRMGRLSTIPM